MWKIFVLEVVDKTHPGNGNPRPRESPMAAILLTRGAGLAPRARRASCRYDEIAPRCVLHPREDEMNSEKSRLAEHKSRRRRLFREKYAVAYKAYGEQNRAMREL